MFRTSVQDDRFDVAVVGAGLAGLVTALRLQAAGSTTVVLEAHGHAGGCAGYYRRRGFSFDVGATTLVDFEPGGVGAELFDAVGMPPLPGEALPGYVAWLPDRTVVLHRDAGAWHRERLRALGDTDRHRRFWALLDRLSDAFWRASRAGARMPVRGPADLVHNARAMRLTDLHLARHVTGTLGGALRRHGLRDDAALVGLLSMLVEDTVHSSVDDAPLVNAALGITIRGAGLTRATGGMRGFWRAAVAHYRSLGGDLRCGWRVTGVTGAAPHFTVDGPRGTVRAAQVVSAVPVATTASLAPAARPALERFLRRDAGDLGGAAMVCLGVPEEEVAGQEFTHHQLLRSYAEPLGDGNNMFVSVSAAGDHDSAPPGHRAVMLSTHTGLAGWEDLDDAGHARRRAALGDRLVAEARRVFPRLGERAVVREVGTPRTYARFTSRPLGAVGGVRQRTSNANQHAVPHRSAVPGLWLVGDSTWPGLGTVACVLGSRIVAEGVLCGPGVRRGLPVTDGLVRA
ncbi:NAD(P)/FAD-dependent oxidoreductase [Dactylosporangium sp. NPDC050588]|uniref:phytoene desaturase family protein n=1 Tax=Dactylosporangium sp. NPDC050588 TaxID=3157211 RepID=UPI0033FC9C1D